MAETGKKLGLLKKAQGLLSDMTPKFHVWAKRNGFKMCGIFSPIKTKEGEFYCMTDSFGFNAKTIASAVTEKTFWSGKIAKSFDWQCFSNTFNEIEPYKQLFAPDIREQIGSLNFLPFYDKEKPYIFVAVETVDEEDEINLPAAAECCSVLRNIIVSKGNEAKLIEKMETNIESGLAISNANLFILSLKTSIANAISGVEADTSNEELRQAVSESIAGVAHVIIEPMFRNPNCSHVGKNGEIKLAMFAKDEQDEQILAYHIASNLATLLGADAVKNVIMLNAGICPNKKGTLFFLLHG